MKYCCEKMDEAVENVAIREPGDLFSESKDFVVEYCVDYVYEHWEYMNINYCPFCGGKLDEEKTASR